MSRADSAGTKRRPAAVRLNRSSHDGPPMERYPAVRFLFGFMPKRKRTGLQRLTATS